MATTGITTVNIYPKDLPSICEAMFATGGKLNTAIPEFSARPQQTAMAKTISEAILHQSTVVIEAGTGTGKTFAYLIPCLLSGKKVVVSTATKTLQDQLVCKDLPLLIQAMGLSTQVQNLKGRNNYICRHRTQLFAEEGQLQSVTCAEDIAYVREKLSQLTHGERSELPHLREDSLAWPYVTSTNDNCLGRACDEYEHCFLMQARKRAITADVVVINHHIFFADSRLKQEGFGELLPQVEAVIFDEAHQLANIAEGFYGSQFGTKQLRELYDDMLRAWPVLDLINYPWKQWSVVLDQILDRLWLALPEGTCAWKQVLYIPAFVQAWAEFSAFLERWVATMPLDQNSEQPELSQCNSRLTALYSLIQQFHQPSATQIFWVEKFKRTVVFHQTPLDIRADIKLLLNRYACAYIFTSATLTLANSFSCFTQPLGLEAPVTEFFSSPFNFMEQALLYLPRGLPDPNNLRYYEILMTKVLPVIRACKGRCFFLFTSHRALQDMAKRLKKHLSFPLLVQGEEAKPILLARFRELGNAVLLGTATFWEGVDVKGEALSCVIIDKIPFLNPKDPVLQGKSKFYEAQGLSGFAELSLPAAVLALKQGVGRLIRDVSDRGVLMLADPRLTARAYGADVFASLPMMRKTRHEQTVIDFIERGFKQ